MLVPIIKLIGGKIVMSKIKAWLSRKAKASMKSATMGTAAGIIAAGVWVQQHPEVLLALGDYQGVALAAVGVVVAIARLRTAGK